MNMFITRIKQFLTSLTGKVKCEHDWKINGWTSVKCKRCDKVWHNEELCTQMHREMWERRVDESPMFTREAINKVISKTGIII
jgi:hypothetical protein